MLLSENLHPILVRKVKPIFIRGDYDTATFQAFKVVEVQVRKKGGYAESDIGVPLMREAFRSHLRQDRLLIRNQKKQINR